MTGQKYVFASEKKKALLLAIQHPIWYIICSQRLTSSEVKPLNQFISTVNDTGFESMMSECDIGEGWCEPTNSPEFSKYIRHITFGIPNFDWATLLKTEHRNPILTMRLKLMIQAAAFKGNNIIYELYVTLIHKLRSKGDIMYIYIY